MGFLSPLYAAVTWVLLHIHSGVSYVLPPDSGAAWVVSIVLLVVAVRLVLSPLFVKQIKSSRKMQELQPQMKELQRKYKNDKQRQQQEMMKLYQEHGANPLGGCLPVLVQLPVFYGLFQVLRRIVLDHPHPEWGLTAQAVNSASHAKLFGASIADRLFTTGVYMGNSDQLVALAESPLNAKIMAIVMSVTAATTMFFTMRMSMRRSPTPQTGSNGEPNPMASMQKIMPMLAPVIALVELTLPIGLLFYILTTNVWTLAQNSFIYRRYPTSTATSGSSSEGTKPQPGGNGSGPSKGGPRSGAQGSSSRKQPSTQEPSAQQRVVRQQRVNQPRSKRSGSRKR